MRRLLVQGLSACALTPDGRLKSGRLAGLTMGRVVSARRRPDNGSSPG